MVESAHESFKNESDSHGIVDPKELWEPMGLKEETLSIHYSRKF